jgi:hypothetical protein
MFLQHVDLSLSLSILPWGRTAMAVESAAASAAVVFVNVVRRAELLRVDDLDGPTLARVAFITVTNVPRPSSCTVS